MTDKKERKRLDGMTSSDRDEAIKRLERERLKVNAEIESILQSYAKESGNRALKGRKRRYGALPNDWDFSSGD